MQGINNEGVAVRNKDSNCEHWPNSPESSAKSTCENEQNFSEDMNSSIFGLAIQNSDSQPAECDVLLQEDNSNSQNMLNVNSFIVENSNLQSGQLLSDMNGQTEKTVAMQSIEQLNTHCMDELSVKSSFESLRNCTNMENMLPDSKASWMVEDLSVVCKRHALSGVDCATGRNELNDSFSGKTEVNEVAAELEDGSLIHVENSKAVKAGDYVDGNLDEIINTQIVGDPDNCAGLKIDSEKTQSQQPEVCSVINKPNLTAIQYNSSKNGSCGDDGYHFENDISICQKNNEINDISFMQGCTIDLSYHSRKISQSEAKFDQVTQCMGQINHEALEDDSLLQNRMMKKDSGNNGEIVLNLTKPLADSVVPGEDWLEGSNILCANVKEQVSSPCCSCDGLDSTSMPSTATVCVSKSLPLKEDSVTEEKEIEESKSESYNYTQHRENDTMEIGMTDAKLSISSDIADQLKDNYFNTPTQSATVACVHENAAKLALNNAQPVSIPFGGARPKQPLNLKLQIPKPLTNQLLNDLGSTNSANNAKNKNVGFIDKTDHPEDASFCSLNGGALDCSINGDELGVCCAGASKDINSDYTLGAESPDNDLRAGQFSGTLRKPFTTLGDVAPVWVPDSQAPNCMKCELKFTFTKRRHHCRACGKVFCAACCSLKCKLSYMDMKEARVCVTCHTVLTSSQAWENMFTASASSPNPNNPAEYCSTIPPLQQAQASGALSSPPPTVMVPVGVLKHPGTEVTQAKEQRRVWFADGILPNGEVADAAKLSTSGPSLTGPLAVSHDPGKEVATNSKDSENVATLSTGSPAQIGSPVGSSINLVPEDGLPPILISTGVKGDYAVEEQPSQISLMLQLEEGSPDPLVFVLNANLLVMVKLVNYVNRKCWSFTTKGMHAVGQAEIVILLQCLPDEKCIPKDIFSHCIQLYQDALAGNVVGDLGHSFFTQSFLGSREHGGFLYVTATFQSLQDLVLPNPPYLFGILIQKWETPWAKVFPIRLMLRLGAEYRFYPCPLFSVRFRKPLFGETGHTIMNLLADFRNYQYKLPVVQGLVVDMEVRRTCINVPSNRYNEMMKAMNKSNEHVLAFGACFNEKADSHLVCVQNDDGNYQTQAISIHNQPRKVTGASFFVFSGALKSSSGYLAKSSIVEDGMMVQISAETMDSLRQTLREMKDFTITCGKIDAEEPQEHVHIQWTEDDKNINKGVVSPIDGKSMDEIASVKIFHGSEFKTNGKVIRWTEVFFLQSEDQPSGLSDPADHSKLTENVAKAFCLALCPHLKLLKEDGKAKLGLRVTLDSDQVGYQAGSNGQPLPSQYMNDLDNALVPVIHGGACQLSEGSVVIELIFYILESFS
ncbi:zinc finger FYVE domain-containing protein 9-like isoform X1 [Scyliorhinus torazame]|uniref:zinc finger FYVE domain-containing protein 9-like isoform X1 n=1 Tax=Scyliorhinus torazame TaxID=75743 RepID=UPI003B5A99CE